MGVTQQAWLDGQMTTSKATWQILGNQTVMARIRIAASVLQANLSAASVNGKRRVNTVSTASYFLPQPFQAIRASVLFAVRRSNCSGSNSPPTHLR